jgi:glycosyltransferase involved in cell wall biosynthesis
MKAITISGENSRSFLRYYGFASFAEIYNGRVQPEKSSKFHLVDQDMQKLKKDGATLFLHVGSCGGAKNQRMLVNVFNRLIANGENVVLFIIGAGFDSEEGRELQSVANDKIFFLGEKHNVSDYFLSTEAFCLSSTYEGMPISLIEAFACGCIPICTPVSGIVDTIQNGKNGYLSKSITEDAYFDTIMNYLKNKSGINKDDLITYYRSNFSIDECASKHVQLYSD